MLTGLYSAVSYIELGLSALAIVVAVRSALWQNGTIVDRLFVLAGVVGTIGFIGLTAMCARKGTALFAVLLETAGLVTLPLPVACPHRDCQGAVLALLTVLMVVVGGAGTFYLAGLLTVLKARGWWRLVGVAFLLPVAAALGAASAPLRSVEVAFSGPWR